MYGRWTIVETITGGEVCRTFRGTLGEALAWVRRRELAATEAGTFYAAQVRA